MKNEIKKLAVSGLLGGALALGSASCGKAEDPGPDQAKKGPDKSAAPAAKPDKPATAATYSEIHGCAGMNACKGLGGCAVDAAKLKELAAKAGVALDKAGQPHACAGMNACKGLGGCNVDAARLAQLKAKLAE
ncbi:MAG: hypothetical protein MJE77_43910 [Proteobacteria bacterium]|nr:hypothetical protein [Pseudomonadota bacterium]